jgi:hypothetical protein
VITAQFSTGSAGRALKAHGYRVASRLVATDVSVTELKPFKTEEPCEGSPLSRLPRLSQLSRLSSPAAAHGQMGGATVFRGSGLVAGEERGVECESGPDGYRLAVEGVGLFAVSGDGQLAACLETHAGMSLVTGTMLGPALILALALQGVWCLHAGAVASGDQVVAFVGESGRGKSTLARFAHGHQHTPWRRVADDVLPVSACARGALALPHFPQLKLKPEDQVSSHEPEQMPLKAVYLLDGPEAGRKKISILRLTPREAILSLVRHTHAARLFDKKLMARHLEFSTLACAAVPVRRLCYPRELALLPAVFRAMEEDLFG